MTPRVVTGLGVVSTLGVGLEAFFEGMRSGARPTPGDAAPVETFDASKYSGARLAEVRGFDTKRYLGDKGLRTLDRLSKLLIVATRLALDHAALKRAGAWAASGQGERPWPERVGLVVSNAYGSLEAISELDRVALVEDPRYINPARFPLTVSNSAAGYASIWEDVRALNMTVSGGSTAALDAIACADLMLESSRADVILVGGAEAMAEALFVAFRRLGLAQGGRGAAALGEGAAMMALETRGSARTRGAEPIAEITGYGTSFAPPERAASLVHPSADALQRAMLDALADAGVPGEDVDLVVSGISGLRPFDQAEITAVRRVFGEGVPVTAPKLDLGETLGASGAMAVAAAIAHVCEKAPPRPVYGTLRGSVRTVLVTALGHYGSASALVMRRPSR